MFKRLFVWQANSAPGYCWISSVEPSWIERIDFIGRWYRRSQNTVLSIYCKTARSVFGITVPKSPADLLEIRDGKEYATWYME